MSTNVPQIQWSNGSPVLPSEQDILVGVQADINAAFGGGVNSGLTTPQGQLAQTETAIIGDKNSEIAYISNQVNPSMASGIWQDAIGYIYFLTRIQAAGTVVSCNCVGAVGTVIPEGAVAKDTSGYLYSSTAEATIPATGIITVQFQNQTTGAIACNIGALSIIYTAVAGWDTVTNPTAGALGNDVESRQAFEARRAASVASNSLNSVQSIYGALAALPDVIDVFVIDNPTSSTLNYGITNYPISAHSLCASVAGGTTSEIATAIWDKKPPGCKLIGNTSTSVYDYYYIPPVSYVIYWLTPTSTPTYFVVQIVNNALLPSNIIELTQNAVVESFNGLDGLGSAVGIAQTTYSGRYYANINAINTNVNVKEVYLTNGYNNSVVATAFVIGQYYTIKALGSTTQAQWNTAAGTIGVTYAVGSTFLCVAAGVGTGTALAYFLLVQFGIDQLPTLAASNVTVSLI